MLRIRDITYSVGVNGWNVKSRKPYLEVTVKPTSNGMDIGMISYCLNEYDDVTSGNISVEVLNSIVSNSTVFTRQDWIENVEDLTHVTTFERMMMGMNSNDIYNASTPYRTIFHSSSDQNKSSGSQQLLDCFIIEISLYLSLMDMLYNYGRAWMILPFHWDLPHDDFDSRILNRNTVEYIMTPLKVSKILGSTIVSQIVWCLEYFQNTWSMFFREGDEMNNSDSIFKITVSMLETVSIKSHRDAIEQKEAIQKLLQIEQERWAKHYGWISSKTVSHEHAIKTLTGRITHVEDKHSEDLEQLKSTMYEEIRKLRQELENMQAEINMQVEEISTLREQVITSTEK